MATFAVEGRVWNDGNGGLWAARPTFAAKARVWNDGNGVLAGLLALAKNNL